MQITLTRDSVAMGDDALAPHERTVELPDPATVGDAVAVVARGYLASISGGRATWVVRVGASALSSDRPAVAVVAQQWTGPVLLVDPATPLGPDERLVHADYLTQRDPDVVLEELRGGTAFPARHDPAPS